VFRWLKSFKISVASEAKQRVLAKEVLGDNLVAELVHTLLTKKGVGNASEMFLLHTCPTSSGELLISLKDIEGINHK
jgi:hypothetical protein